MATPYIEAWNDPCPWWVLGAGLEAVGGLVWLDGESRGWGEVAAGRHSYLAAGPVEQVVVAAEQHTDPLAALPLWPSPGAAHCQAAPGGHAPQWVLMLSYDLQAAYGLPVPRASGAGSALPQAPWLVCQRYDAVLWRDHVLRRSWLVGDDRQAVRRLRTRLETARHGPIPSPGRAAASHSAAWQVTSAADFQQAVASAVRDIHAGALYQVNLSRRWRAPWHGHALTLWRRWRRRSPVPRGLYWDLGQHVLLGRSMECFLHWDSVHGVLQSAPIKGTIAVPDESLRLAQGRALRAHPKEAAEHTMVVDLMRNELGQVARTGTVRVIRFAALEAYAGLSHLVSTVRCHTVPKLPLGALLRATFAPGSVTGTPKRSALGTIATLENVARGPYTGCYGLLSRSGQLHLAVTIRTGLVHAGHIDYHAGCGIVADSCPARELAESELKASHFLQLLRPRSCCR